MLPHPSRARYFPFTDATVSCSCHVTDVVAWARPQQAAAPSVVAFAAPTSSEQGGRAMWRLDTVQARLAEAVRKIDGRGVLRPSKVSGR
jgi:hypothetical protein